MPALSRTNPFYAYEEFLAYFKEKATEAETMLVAMTRIASQITNLTLNLPQADPGEQERVLKQYAAFGLESVADAAPQPRRRDLGTVPYPPMIRTRRARLAFCYSVDWATLS